MLFNQQLVYFALHKTGCTHTLKALEELPDQNWQEVGKKHQSFGTLSKNWQAQLKPLVKMGNIRNPWDWYVSLWAFGCMKKGQLYKHSTAPFHWKNLSHWKALIKQPKKRLSKHDQKRWEKAYSDPYSPQCFQLWLDLTLNSTHDYGLEYHGSGVQAFSGFYTFRVCHMYTPHFVLDHPNIKSYDELKTYFEQAYFLDLLIRNEHWSQDFKKALKELGWLNDKIESFLDLKSNKRTNSSSRKDYRYYYNEHTYDLVNTRDKLIIDHYHY